jgi:hypothetical protein
MDGHFEQEAVDEIQVIQMNGLIIGFSMLA